MKYLFKSPEAWVAIRNELIQNRSDEKLIDDLRSRTNAVQTWFFDLDDNHAKSPAKKIALDRVGTNLFSPRFIWWALTEGVPAKLIKSRESEAWKRYINNFLRDEKSLQEVKELYTEEIVRQSLYPGVSDFIDLFSDARKFYVTRNIAEVAQIYSAVLGIDDFFPEADDKSKVVERYLKDHPETKIVGVDGDSEEDGAMIDVARFYDREVVSFYSMNEPKDSQMNKKFDYSVSKDRSGLVELLR